MFFTVKYRIKQKIENYKKQIDDLIKERNDYNTIYETAITFYDTVSVSKNKDKILHLLNSEENPRSEKVLLKLSAYRENTLVSLLKDLPVPELTGFSKNDSAALDRNKLMLKCFKDILFAQEARPLINTPNNKSEKNLNVAFAGGGAKGFAHIGSIRRILEEPHLKIGSVAGTSAGAIAALPFALGFDADKLEKMVLETDFSMFIYESNINNGVGNLFSKKKKLLFQTSFLRTVQEELNDTFYEYVLKSQQLRDLLDIKFDDNIQKTKNDQLYYIKDLFKSPTFLNSARRNGLIKFMFNEPKKELKNIIKNAQKNARQDVINSKPFKALQTIGTSHYNESQKDLLKHFSQDPHKELMTFLRLERKEDLIEEYFGDMIYQSLRKINPMILKEVFGTETVNEFQLRDLSFRQFKHLREALDKRNIEHNFKDICICICQLKEKNFTKMLDKENYIQVDAHADSEESSVANMPIKTAVRISMNLPGVFKSYTYDNKNWADGGVRANFPLHYFKKQNKPDNESIGFSLAQENSYRYADKVNNIGKTFHVEANSNYFIERIFEKGIGFISKMMEMNHARKLDNLSEYNELDLMRIGITNVEKTGTLAFDLDTHGKIKLLEAGYKSANDLFTPYYHAQMSFYGNKLSALIEKIKEEVGEASKKDFIFGRNLVSDEYLKEQNEFLSYISPKKEYQVKKKMKIR